MIFRTATRQDLPAVLALLTQDENPAAAGTGAPEPVSEAPRTGSTSGWATPGATRASNCR
ncbi:hypothetical protein [Streptomyces sp. NPDC003952]